MATSTGGWLALDPSGDTAPGLIVGAGGSQPILADPLVVRVGANLHRLDLPSRPAVDGASDVCGDAAAQTQILATRVSAVMVAGTQLITVSGERVAAISLTDGQEQWGRLFDGPPQPMWADDEVVAVSRLTEAGLVLEVLDVNTGRTQWTGQPDKAAVSIGHGLVATFGGLGPMVIRDASTGETRVEVATTRPARSATTDGDLVAVVTDDGVVVADLANGQEVWSWQLADVEQAVVAGRMVVVRFGRDGPADVGVFELGRQVRVWGADGSVDIIPQGVLVTTDGTVRLVDVDTGRVRWKVRADASLVVRGAGREVGTASDARGADPVVLTYKEAPEGTVAEVRNLDTGEISTTWLSGSVTDPLTLGVATIVSTPGNRLTMGIRSVVVRDRETGDVVADLPVPEGEQAPIVVATDPLILLADGDLIHVSIPAVSTRVS